MIYMPVPNQEEWRIEMLKELIDVKWGDATIDYFDDREITEIIEEICTT